MIVISENTKIKQLKTIIYKQSIITSLLINSLTFFKAILEASLLAFPGSSVLLELRIVQGLITVGEMNLHLSHFNRLL